MNRRRTLSLMCAEIISLAACSGLLGIVHDSHAALAENLQNTVGSDALRMPSGVAVRFVIGNGWAVACASHGRLQTHCL